MEVHMLTTVDNPFHPFHQYDEWNAWDMSHGYHTNAYLARILITSDNLSDADEDEAIEAAIDEIIQENVYGMHIKVTADDELPRKVTVTIDGSLD